MVMTLPPTPNTHTQSVHKIAGLNLFLGAQIKCILTCSDWSCLRDIWESLLVYFCQPVTPLILMGCAWRVISSWREYALTEPITSAREYFTYPLKSEKHEGINRKMLIGLSIVAKVNIIRGLYVFQIGLWHFCVSVYICRRKLSIIGEQIGIV